MERACRGSAGGGAGAHDAHGQTHQCRFSDGGLDPAGQHHDARAGHRTGAIDGARAGSNGECAVAVTAPSVDGRGRTGQEAARTEILARGAGSACAGGASSSGGRQRLMLSKAAAGR